MANRRILADVSESRMMATASTGNRKAAANSRSRALHLVIALSSVALAGCAVGPDYSTPTTDLPARWGDAKTTQTPKAANLAQWWRRLNDPVLNDLVEQAVQGNLDVATAKAKIREARAMQREAVGALFPSLTGSGSATRNQVSSNSAAAAPRRRRPASTINSRPASTPVGSSMCSAPTAAPSRPRPTGPTRPKTSCARRWSR
jgi:4-diphosphocytidyl-2C-methyl-D-erythritol kinase